MIIITESFGIINTEAINFKKTLRPRGRRRDGLRILNEGAYVQKGGEEHMHNPLSQVSIIILLNCENQVKF